MIRPANEWLNPLRFCPDCGSSTVTRIMYGYPAPSEFIEGTVYGGAECTPESATHFCLMCKTTWQALGCDQLCFENASPDTCQFCEASLSDADKFQCEVEYQGWIGGDRQNLQLEERFASTDFYMICSTCRRGVEENRRNIALDGTRRLEKSQKTFCIVGMLLIVVLAILQAVEYFFYSGSN
ncbi:MAG: hypothetical protein Aurels2KO_00400 [Aureliella sp.]